MLRFLSLGTSPRRRSCVNAISDSLSALESRQLPSAATFPQPTASVSPSANGNVHDYTGNWKINGDPALTLVLNQDSHNRLSGYLLATNSIYVEVRGKVGDGMKFKGKGAYQGAEAKISFSVYQTITTNGILEFFSGDLTVKYNGTPKLISTMTADRI